jgi:hypothetical protein
MTKICTKCGIEKDVGEFNHDKQKKDGMDCWCRDCRKAYHRQYHKDNKIRLNKKSTDWQKNNPERYKKKMTAWYQENREYVIKKTRKHHQEHKEERKKQGKEYRQTPRGKDSHNLNSSKRRAAKKSAKINDFTTEEWIKIKEIYQNHCLCCGIKTDKLTMDHVIPLSKGGNHTKDNIQPLCKLCNSIKHTNVIDYRVSCHVKKNK